MRYVVHKCEKCPDPTLHKMLGGGENDTTMVQCEVCETLGNRPNARRTNNPVKARWPHYNESTGVTFTSKEHEADYVKKNNLTAL